MALFEEGKFFKKAGESSGGGGGGDVDYNRVVEKTTSALPTPTAALNGKAYMYVGETDTEDNTKRNGAIYECTQGVIPSSVSSSFVSQTITEVSIWSKETLTEYLGFSSKDATAVFTYVRGEQQETISPTDGEEQGIGWSIPDSSAFLTAVHAKFSGIDFYGETPVAYIDVFYDGVWNVILLDYNWDTFPDTQQQTISDPSEIGLVVDGDVSGLGVWRIEITPSMETAESWQYNGATVESLGDIGIDLLGTPSNGDTITVVYTAAAEGYVWKPVDNKYFKLPPLLGYTNEIIQCIGFGDERGRFYQVEETGYTEPQYSITQTAGTELSDLGMGWESWKFGDQLGWPSDDVDVVFKFIETTQTTGNVTYNLTNIQATIDLNTFYSALVEITTVDMANMYKPEYATDGWQIAVKDQNDNWSIIARSIDPAHWGITITSGTPVAWQDSIEVYFTAFGGDSWEEYVDGTLFKSVPAKEWGIVYSGTPEAGVELLGHYTPQSSTYGWKEIKNIGVASKAVTKQLTVHGWQNNEQELSDFGNFPLGLANALIVTPTPESMDAYVSAGVMCISHNNWSVTFSCKTVPSVELSVNIAII